MQSNLHNLRRNRLKFIKVEVKWRAKLLWIAFSHTAFYCTNMRITNFYYFVWGNWFLPYKNASTYHSVIFVDIIKEKSNIVKKDKTKLTKKTLDKMPKWTKKLPHFMIDNVFRHYHINGRFRFKCKSFKTGVENLRRTETKQWIWKATPLTYRLLFLWFSENK